MKNDAKVWYNGDGNVPKTKDQLYLYLRPNERDL
jgi:hypothetical protein